MLWQRSVYLRKTFPRSLEPKINNHRNVTNRASWVVGKASHSVFTVRTIASYAEETSSAREWESQSVWDLPPVHTSSTACSLHFDLELMSLPLLLGFRKTMRCYKNNLINCLFFDNLHALAFILHQNNTFLPVATSVLIWLNLSIF